MATFNATIMGGDAQRDLEKKLVELCGLSYGEYLENREIVTREVLEGNFDEIINFIHKSRSDCIAHQVFGYFILFTGSKLPTHEKDHILSCSNWETEKCFWLQNPKLARERKFFLNDFRQKILSHTSGQITELEHLFRECI